MASVTPFPLMPPRSTDLRLDHFDEYVYTADSTTLLYKFVDALCGDTGAGSLIKEIFLARLGGALETIYFNDLDYIFGNISFLARSPAETYPYNPMTDQLTSDQWDEVRVKDAWYRDRVKQFFIACGLGGTINGIRTVVNAAVAVDCEIFEVWRYVDNFGLTADLGRAPSSARNEYVIRPHKDSLAPVEFRLLRDMLRKIMPMDVISTINMLGLAVSSPVPVTAAAADSTYYEVQKVVTGTPVLDQLPPPDLLAIDLLPSEKWLLSGNPELAPYTAFNISSEYGYYYLIGGGKRSPIDSVTYGTLQAISKLTIFEVCGSKVSPFLFPPFVPSPISSWLNGNLDPDLFSYQQITFPESVFPLFTNGIQFGVAKLKQAIRNTTGQFVLVGEGHGAHIISLVYDDIRNGSLMDRRGDLLAGVALGNPRRGEGFFFPGCEDFDGHGICDDRLDDCDSFWWEICNPDDVIGCVQDDFDGQNYTNSYQCYLDSYTGEIDGLIEGVIGIVFAPILIVTSLFNCFWGPRDDVSRSHLSYDTYQPLLHLNDTRSGHKIAIDYIASLGGVEVDPVHVVRPEGNFEVYEDIQQFTPFREWDKGDCPDNYPGGKYGMHPGTSPALNVDGTNYAFPFLTQALYVAAQITKILALGGKADENHYCLPIQKPQRAKKVFTPDQAIAYYPPGKDSTITTSWTSRRKKGRVTNWKARTDWAVRT